MDSNVRGAFFVNVESGSFRLLRKNSPDTLSGDFQEYVQVAEDGSEKEKLGKRKRVLGWALRRANADAVITGAKAASSIGKEVWNSTFKPLEIDKDEAKAGYEGRYRDGGWKRFADMVAASRLTEADLRDKVRDWRNQAIIFLAGAFLMLIAGLAWMIFNRSGFSAFVGLASLSLFAALVALSGKCDYSAWQIENRRFAGLREYIHARIGF